jgi:hypothetical protein
MTPDFIMGELPHDSYQTILITPFGKLFQKLPITVKLIKLCLAGLKTTVFPIINAGISKEKVFVQR